ncbi:N-acetyltransferase family protein [Methanolobus sp. ZRKC2]|uniref:GNAT family N-acetyltransferase n=1 Tax=Methanolobus sp. ZRKC2 TaxID=3125783 RepID=UPI00324D3466
MSEYTLEPLNLSHRNAVVDIFNYYIENSFAAYPENKVPYEFYDMILQSSAGHPADAVKNEDGAIVGFGLLRPHSPMPAFSGTAETSYFIRPDSRGLGIGSILLDHLINQARETGLHCVLANISSLNEESLSFHARRGFTECGRFREVGKKKGRFFDTVWMQKIL